MTKAAGSAGAGRDGRLQELVKQWRSRAENDARDDGTAAEFADELEAILAVPDPLASDTGQGWIEQRLRQEWWTGHGCPFHALYGDDGEMQCNALTCMRDFKREPMERLREHVEMRRVTLAIAAASAPLASSSEPQVTFSTTTVDGPSTAAPGMPTIGGSSLPVRASGEPQDDGTFHPQDFYRAGLLRAAEIAERMKRGPWGDPHDTITHEHLVEQIVAAILAAASLSDDGGRQPQDRFTTLLDEWKARYPIDQTGGSGRCYAAFISAHALVDDLRAAASDDGAAQLEQLKAFRPTTDQPTDADIADAGAARPQPAQDETRDDMRVIHSSEIADDPAAFEGDYVPLEDVEAAIAHKLAALSSPSVADSPTWQPIDTHDGSSNKPVLVADRGDVVEAYFSAEHDAWWEINSCDDGSPGSDRRVYPTHWMPLPNPPSDIQQKIATSILPVVETSRAARQGEASGGTEEDPQ